MSALRHHQFLYITVKGMCNIIHILPRKYIKRIYKVKLSYPQMHFLLPMYI